MAIEGSEFMFVTFLRDEALSATLLPNPWQEAWNCS